MGKNHEFRFTQRRKINGTKECDMGTSVYLRVRLFVGWLLRALDRWWFQVVDMPFLMSRVEPSRLSGHRTFFPAIPPQNFFYANIPRQICIYFKLSPQFRSSRAIWGTRRTEQPAHRFIWFHSTKYCIHVFAGLDPGTWVYACRRYRGVAHAYGKLLWCF